MKLAVAQVGVSLFEHNLSGEHARFDAAVVARVADVARALIYVLTLMGRVSVEVILTYRAFEEAQVLDG